MQIVIEEAVSKTASIICPVFNMAGRLQLLDKWIQEVSSNSQIEAIVVNDISDDATSNQLREICKGLENVKIIEGKFGNPGSARNAGLELCQGKWVIFWDCDDEPNVPNLFKLIEESERTSSDIGFGSYKVFNERTRLSSHSSPWVSDKQINLSAVAQIPGIWRIVFSKHLLDGIRFEPLKMAEDQIFIARTLLRAQKIDFSSTQIYTYFTGSPNHLTRNPKALQDLLPAFEKTSEILKNSNTEISPFINIMAARQLISGFKYGNRKTRFGLLLASIKSRLITSPRFINALRITIQHSVRGN